MQFSNRGLATLVFGAVIGFSHSTQAMPTIDSVFSTAETLNSIAFDPTTGFLYIHSDFGNTIDVYNQSGGFQFSITAPGTSSNDFDLDFADSAVNIGGTQVAANTLLVANGDDSPEILFALDKNSGAVLASQTLNSASLVGGAYHVTRDSFFTVDWQGTDLITESNTSDGSVINSFTTTVPGTFGINYGDLDILASTGNLFVVSSQQNLIREFTPDGVFVRDIDLAGIPQLFAMSGIAIDDANEIAWISSTSGSVFQVSGVFTPVPLPAPLLLLLSGVIVIATRVRS